MTEQRPRPGAEQRPVPRDMPDQQARPDEDPWDVAPRRTRTDRPDTDAGNAEDTVPDTDEAGTGPRGAHPDSGTAHSDHPTPQEPPG
ncbi:MULTISPECIES: hypothetical protein [unclassified Streptomyces]|uniref:hypothetical protein n=1 Tax=unclassified Streptomyces TaxID=2593676 RepID=UPI0004BF2C21|nr:MULTISPECIES: hypothetical protein [unclassified Streptomyces]KOV96686.1 hypothetical protein ADL04_16370 [Streptomyces sp. NRRL B-3648]